MHSIDRVALRVLKFAMYLTWALAVLCILFYESLSLYDPLAHFLGLDRFLGDASAVNARGDEVAAETKRSDIVGFRATTVIKAKQADQWFATKLLKVKSDD